MSFTETLHGLLDDAITAGRRLLTLLDDERNAMATGDSAALESLTGDKNLCLGQLETLEQQRQALCARYNLDNDASAMPEVTRSEDPSGRLGEQWDALRALMRQCQAANTVNGHVLRLRRQHVSRALAVLRGETPDTPLYNRDGEEKDNGDPPLLGEA